MRKEGKTGLPEEIAKLSGGGEVHVDGATVVRVKGSFLETMPEFYWDESFDKFRLFAEAKGVRVEYAGHVAGSGWVRKLGNRLLEGEVYLVSDVCCLQVKNQVLPCHRKNRLGLWRVLNRDVDKVGS